MNYQKATENTFANATINNGYNGDTLNISLVYDPQTKKIHEVILQGCYWSGLYADNVAHAIQIVKMHDERYKEVWANIMFNNSEVAESLWRWSWHADVNDVKSLFGLFGFKPFEGFPLVRVN